MRSQLMPDKTGSNVIIDIGRGGFAGEYAPRFTIPSAFRDADHLPPHDLRALCLEVTRALFIEQLQIKSKDCNVLIVENMFASNAVREQLFTVLLQDMQVLSVSFQPDMIMSMVPTGCSSGIVLDIGSNECRALAIAHGRPVLASFTATPIGVVHAQRRFHKTLQMLWGSTDASHEIVPVQLDSRYTETLFERVVVACPYSIAQDVTVRDGLVLTGSIPAAAPVDDDDRVIPGWLRSDCVSSLLYGGDGSDTGPNMLCDLFVCPESMDEIGGAVGCVLSCLLRCSADLRRSLVRHVVICGGGAEIPGVPCEVWRRLSGVTSGACDLSLSIDEESGEHFEKFPQLKRYTQLRHLLTEACLADPADRAHPPEMSSTVSASSTSPGRSTAVAADVDVSSVSVFCRAHLAWVGGSLFASLKSNKARYLSREEYQLRKGGQSSVLGSGFVAGTPLKGKCTTLFSKASDKERVGNNQETVDDSSPHFRMPDWTSTDPSDWRFYGTRGICAAPVVAASSLGTSKLSYSATKKASVTASP